MIESLRTYFSSRQAYKAFLRRQKNCPSPGQASPLLNYFISKDAYRDYVQHAYRACRRELNWNGITLVVKAEAGETRNAHGSIQDTIDADLKPLGFFLGPDLTSDVVWVVDQKKPDGSFDEHKVLIGFRLVAPQNAKAAYLANYAVGWPSYSGARRFTIDQFKRWLLIYDPSRPVVSKALAEASGGTGGYAVIDWNNVRCPSCGGRLLCEECRRNPKMVSDNCFVDGGDIAGANAGNDGIDGLVDIQKEPALAGEPFPESQPRPRAYLAYWRTDRTDFAGSLPRTA